MDAWSAEEKLEWMRSLVYRSAAPTDLVGLLTSQLPPTTDPAELAYREFLADAPALGLSDRAVSIVAEELKKNSSWLFGGGGNLRAALVRVAREVSVGEAHALHALLKVYKRVELSGASLVGGGAVPTGTGSQIVVDGWTMAIQAAWNTGASLDGMVAAALPDYTRRVRRIEVLFEKGYILGRVARLQEVQEFAVHNRYLMNNTTLSTSIWPARASPIEMTLYVEDSLATVGLLVDPFCVAQEDFANSFHENAFTVGSGFLGVKRRTDGCYTVRAQKELFDFLDTLCRNGGDARTVAIHLGDDRRRWVPEVGHGRHGGGGRRGGGQAIESSTSVRHNEQCLYRPSVHDAFLGLFVKSNLVGFFGALKDVATLQCDILRARGLYVPIVLYDSKRNEMQEFVVDELTHALLKSPANVVVRTGAAGPLAEKMARAGLTRPMIDAAVACASTRLRKAVEIQVLLFMAKSPGDKFALFEANTQVRVLDNLHLVFPTIWETKNTGSDVIDPDFALDVNDLEVLARDDNLQHFFRRTLANACRMFLGVDSATLELDDSVALEMYGRDDCMAEFARVVSRALQCLLLFRVDPDLVGRVADRLRRRFPRLGLLPSCVDMLLGSVEMQGIGLLMGRLNGVYPLRTDGSPQFRLVYHHVKDDADKERLNREHRNYFQRFDDGRFGFVSQAGEAMPLHPAVALPAGHKSQPVETTTPPTLPALKVPALLASNALDVLRPVAVSDATMRTAVETEYVQLRALVEHATFSSLPPATQLQVEACLVDHVQASKLLGGSLDAAFAAAVCRRFGQSAGGVDLVADEATPIGWYIKRLHSPELLYPECPFVEKRTTVTTVARVARRGGRSSNESTKTERYENIWRDAVTVAQQRAALANLLRLSSESARVYHDLGLLLTEHPALGAVPRTYAAVGAVAKFDVDVGFHDHAKLHPKAPFLNVRDVLGANAINLLSGGAMDPDVVHNDQDTFRLSINACILQNLPPGETTPSAATIARLLTRTLAVTVSGDDTVIRANGLYYAANPAPTAGQPNEYHNGNEKFRFRSNRPRRFGDWAGAGGYGGMGKYTVDALRAVESYDQGLLSDQERRYKRAYLIGSAFVTTSAKGGFNSARVPTSPQRVLFLDTRGPQFEKADSPTFQYADGTTVPNALECADFVSPTDARPADCIFQELADASQRELVGTRKGHPVYFDRGAYFQATLTYVAHIVAVVRQRMSEPGPVAGSPVHLKATLFGGGFFAKYGGTNSPIDLRRLVVEAMLEAYTACLPLMRGCVSVLEFVRYDIDGATRPGMDKLAAAASEMGIAVVESPEGDLLDLSVVADGHVPALLNAGDAMSWCGNEADSASVEAMIGNATNVRVTMNAWANPRMLEPDRHDVIAVPLPLTPRVAEAMAMVLEVLGAPPVEAAGMCDVPLTIRPPGGAASVRVYTVVLFGTAATPTEPEFAGTLVHGFQMRGDGVRVLTSSPDGTVHAKDIDNPSNSVDLEPHVVAWLRGHLGAWLGV